MKEPRCRVTDELDAWEREQDRLERAEEYDLAQDDNDNDQEDE